MVVGPIALTGVYPQGSCKRDHYHRIDTETIFLFLIFCKDGAIVKLNRLEANFKLVPSHRCPLCSAVTWRDSLMYEVVLCWQLYIERQGDV